MCKMKPRNEEKNKKKKKHMVFHEVPVNRSTPLLTGVYAKFEWVLWSTWWDAWPLRLPALVAVGVDAAARRADELFVCLGCLYLCALFSLPCAPFFCRIITAGMLFCRVGWRPLSLVTWGSPWAPPWPLWMLRSTQLAL